MADFLERLNAAIDQAEQRERAALAEAPGDWRVHHTGGDESREYIVVAYGPDGPDCDVMITGSRADAERVAANDPAAVLRNIAEDRAVLQRHAPSDDIDPNSSMCVACFGGPWINCDEIRSIGRRYGITPEEAP